MFWRFGGYANISTIDTLLDKQDVVLEELLDESDLIQELKQHNSKLMEYLRQESVLEKLLAYVTAPRLELVVAEDSETDDAPAKGDEPQPNPDQALEIEDEREKKRNRYAFVAAEILSSDNWSLCEALMEQTTLMTTFWDFLKQPPPLDPLQASYFTKVNESLFDKKTEEMLGLLKSFDGIVKTLLQHVDSPMIMDLLLKIVSLEKVDGGQGIVDWLCSQDMVPILLSFLSSEHSWATQTSAGDFLKAIITISANASQNEQSCIGPNELTRQLVSHDCVEKLIQDMLKGGNPLTVGVGIIIEVIRKNNSDYDPDVGAEPNATPTSRDPIYLGTLLRLFAEHVPDFMELILSPNQTIGGGEGPLRVRRKELQAASGRSIEPLGFDRFKTCELMAELLHCSNMGLLNEPGSEEFIKAKDEERERLRREGMLGAFSDLPSHLEDDLTMKSSTNTHSGSPDTSRRLEIQNASDDDFEEVTHATDLGDESRDELIEKPDMEDMPTLSRSAVPVSFLDKHEIDDFVDEPLTSPRLQYSHSTYDEPDMTVLPLSPTKDLAAKVESLGVQREEHPASATSRNSLEAKPTEDPESLPHGARDDPQKGPQADSLHDTTLSDDTTSGGSANTTHGDTSTSNNEPAPLSIIKSTASNPATEAPRSENSESNTEFTDTTAGDGAEEAVSVLLDNSDEQAQGMASDQDSSPVVGDFLKMQFVEHKVVPTIVDFFFRFPWNNFLHNVVYDVVQQVFNGPMTRGYNRNLAIDLFDTGHITMRIVDGQAKSDQSQEKQKMRLGYMGHLTLIAEEVVKFTERHPPELLSESVLEKVMNGEWITYVEVTLAGTRERDNAILGGVRPDGGGPRQLGMNTMNGNGTLSGSSALADAGLNGSAGLDSIDIGNGSSSNAYSIGGGLISGFGSSSDEEDDDVEDDADEEGNRGFAVGPEFSRYISHSSTTTSSIAATDLDPDSQPPSIPPPPPPPLNLGPSRARRQLAARLALHKQNAEGSGDGIDKGNRVNPFASADEDDDDDEADHTFRSDDFTIDDFGDPADAASAHSRDHQQHVMGGTEGVAEMDGDMGGERLLSSSDDEIHSSSSGSEASDEDHDLGASMVRHPGRASPHQQAGDANGRRSAPRSMRTRPRRPSVTEAKRRTSLEDDDDEEMGDPVSGATPDVAKPSTSTNQQKQSMHIDEDGDEMLDISAGRNNPSHKHEASEDSDLIEVQHAEIAHGSETYAGVSER